MSYFLNDHQGGVSTISANSGATDINESFSAFGQRRNPGTWSGAPATTDLNTIAGLSRQGYTFQTWLGQSMGLNHMNGRVQDAILGRFLSPDPHVPDPTDAQSYNRYSHVNNNPLTMTDPTGFQQVPPSRVSLDDEYPLADFWSGGSVQGLTGQMSDGSSLDGVDSESIDLSSLTSWFNGASSAVHSALGGGSSPSVGSDATEGSIGLASNAPAQSGAFNDPNAFNPQTATQQYLQGQSGGATLATPNLDFYPDPTIGTNNFLASAAPSGTPSAAIIGQTTVLGAMAGGSTGLYIGFQAAQVAAPMEAAELTAEGGEVLGLIGGLDAASGLMMTGTKLGGVYGGVAGFGIGVAIYIMQTSPPPPANWQVPYASVAAAP